ncbi:MAG TPA: hypothetical protein VE420_07685 [Gemmatimonadales bacterium]|jgi:hypothetical protein|nr:hypothetical protein [Gemmatimonadales bacterium]
MRLTWPASGTTAAGFASHVVVAMQRRISVMSRKDPQKYFVSGLKSASAPFAIPLEGDHPHLREHYGHGHAHAFTIDDLHRRWPTKQATGRHSTPVSGRT